MTTQTTVKAPAPSVSDLARARARMAEARRAYPKLKPRRRDDERPYLHPLTGIALVGAGIIPPAFVIVAAVCFMLGMTPATAAGYALAVCVLATLWLVPAVYRYWPTSKQARK